MWDFTEDEQLQLLHLTQHPGRGILIQSFKERRQLVDKAIQENITNPLTIREKVYDILNVQAALRGELNEWIEFAEKLVNSTRMQADITQEEAKLQKQVELLEGM